MSIQKIKEFFVFLKQDRQRQINFFLTIFLFSLLPVKNSYTDLKIAASHPLVRQVEVDLPEISFYPVNKTGVSAPYLTAYSVLVVDVDSKAILYAKNPDQKLLPASTTKVMTALVVLDHYQLDQVLKVGEVFPVGQRMRLIEEEEITVENLLYGLLVQSGNDAAYVLAQNYPGGLEGFVQAMNQKASDLYLKNTHFSNPAGIDAEDQLTTTHDLAVLASWAMQNPVFQKMVSTERIVVTDVTGEKEHFLLNINELLGEVPGLKGVKTGWTESAGECLVAYTQNNGQRVITAVLASEDRFGETRLLIDWVFNNHQWEVTQASHQ